MISIDKICKKNSEISVLDDLSFSVNIGEIVGLIGPDGAGKTTTLKAICGLTKIDSGNIDFDGVTISNNATGQHDLRCQLGYVPESAPLIRESTPYKFLNFVAKIKQVASKQRKQHIIDVASSLAIDDLLNVATSSLSAAQQRLFCIASALLAQPKLVLLDEPTKDLDSTQKHIVKTAIRKVAKTSMVIIAGHLVEDVSALADRVVVIAKGSKRFDGTLDNLRSISSHQNCVYLKLSYACDISGLLELPGVADMKHDPVQNAIRIFASPGHDIMPHVLMHVQNQQLPVDMIHMDQVSLEQVVSEVTHLDNYKEVV